ncbi:C2 family cysteine protease [Microbacterium sp. KUDC0406]|uniref:C2 family cysteine protease n=1 Tax=Microbacterium sp. KUDC0406 TaxID=2909588 RepID=UPI001F1D0943|nr:C2 family cysteine protease [Microbacterium sp. KUDC0406]UJP09898.1 C2 family cysteine protease [Microbacterium sp. KUDC0406]
MAYEQVDAGTAGEAFGVGEQIRTMTGEPQTVHSNAQRMETYGSLMGTLSAQLKMLGEAEMSQWAVSGEAVDKLRSAIGDSAQLLAVAGAIYWPVGAALCAYGQATDGHQDELNALAVSCKEAWQAKKAAVAAAKGADEPDPAADDYDEQNTAYKRLLSAAQDAQSEWDALAIQWNNRFVDWRDEYDAAVASLTDPRLDRIRNGEELPPVGDPALYPNGIPSPEDVHQGGIGDCYLLATLAGIANVDPDKIMEMITVNGDGSYTVHFADGDVTVTADQVSDTDQALWVRIFEGAYEQKIGYEDLNDGGWARDVMEDIYGEDADVKDHDGGFWDWLTGGNDVADSFEDIDEALDDGRPVVASAQNGQLGFDGGGHALTVLDAYEVDGQQMVVIRNPWGSNNGHEDAIRAAGGELTTPPDGTFTMSMDEFTKSFNVVEVGNK